MFSKLCKYISCGRGGAAGQPARGQASTLLHKRPQPELTLTPTESRKPGVKPAGRLASPARDTSRNKESLHQTHQGAKNSQSNHSRKIYKFEDMSQKSQVEYERHVKNRVYRRKLGEIWKRLDSVSDERKKKLSAQGMAYDFDEESIKIIDKKQIDESEEFYVEKNWIGKSGSTQYFHEKSTNRFGHVTVSYEDDGENEGREPVRQNSGYRIEKSESGRLQEFIIEKVENKEPQEKLLHESRNVLIPRGELGEEGVKEMQSALESKKELKDQVEMTWGRKKNDSDWIKLFKDLRMKREENFKNI